MEQIRRTVQSLQANTTDSEDGSIATSQSRPAVNHAWGGAIREVQPYRCQSIRHGGTWFAKYKREPPKNDSRTDQEGNVKYGTIDWDVAPTKEYFDQLFRVSKNQIIWGGNYFTLPPCRCFLVWRKRTISENFSMAMAEYAWTSFNGNSKVFEHTPQRGSYSAKFHPTEKPVELYQWVMKLLARDGDKILDTHMGSQSSRLAAWLEGYDYTGCEIDPYYYERGCEWFEQMTSERKVIKGTNVVQTSLF